MRCEGQTKFAHYKIVVDQDVLALDLEALIVLTLQDLSRNITESSEDFMKAKPPTETMKDDHTLRKWGEIS